MKLIRWNPWSLSSLLDEDLDFPTIPGLNRLAQGLNIYETEDALIVEAAVPGIHEDKIDISIDDGVVRISAVTEEKREEKGQRRYFMSSLASAFNYSFRLPEGIADKEPDAEVENGILTLSFRKVQKAPPKKIKVVGKKAEKK